MRESPRLKRGDEVELEISGSAFEGKSIAQTGIPHYPRTAGSPTGAKPKVVFRAVRDFWSLRFRLWFTRSAAMRRGEPILG